MVIPVTHRTVQVRVPLQPIPGRSPRAGRRQVPDTSQSAGRNETEGVASCAALIPAQAVPADARTTVVLDTCVLLADPEALYAFGDADIVLPLTVIEELDNQKTRLDDVGYAARTTVRLLEELRLQNDGDIRAPYQLPGGGTVRVEINGLRLDLLKKYGLPVEKNDNRILAAALGLKQDGRVVKVVSADGAVRIKAAHLGLVAEDYQKTRKHTHTAQNPGWHTVEMSGDVVNELYARKSVHLDDLNETDAAALDGLATNEFVVLRSGQASGMARLQGGELVLVDRNVEAWGLKPKSKEQAFSLSLLLDRSVPVVGLSGAAGTGKTILALAAGLEQVFEPGSKVYDRMMILRPMIAVGRQEMGFLPGDKDEKLGPWFEAIIDAMVALGEHVTHAQAKETLAMWRDSEQLTMEAVTFLRGRSLQNTFILVDEAQNLSPSVLKACLTRVGKGSKIVFLGDVSQIDDPYLSERNNALSVLADTFIGEDLFGHLVLTKGERSAVADLAAKKL